MIPKRIAMKNAERFSLTMAGPITVIAKLFAPLVWLAHQVHKRGCCGHVRAIDPNSGPNSTRSQ